MFFACSITTLKKVQCCTPEASDSKWMSYASIRLPQTHNRYRAKLGRKRNLECPCTFGNCDQQHVSADFKIASREDCECPQHREMTNDRGDSYASLI